MTIVVKNLKKHFGGVVGLSDCSFKIEDGKITALIGPNGSGKSTAFNVISRLIDEDEGDVLVKGRSVKKLPDYKVARLGLSRTFQQVRLFNNLTIKDHLLLALSKNDEKAILSFFSKNRNEEDEKRVTEVLDIVGLDKPEDTLATDLSYGQRKLLDIAIAIAKEHDVLILDEPVAGVNPKLRQQIKDILKKLNKDGATILVIEHDMNFVMDISNHVIVMDEGKVIAQGKPEIIRKDKKVLQAYLGE
jgi:ABC-type branched-subunit amino acid transport system ATPase component